MAFTGPIFTQPKITKYLDIPLGQVAVPKLVVEMRDTGGPASLSDPRAHRGVPRHAPFIADAGTHGRALILVLKFYAVIFFCGCLLYQTANTMENVESFGKLHLRPEAKCGFYFLFSRYSHGLTRITWKFPVPIKKYGK